MAGAANPARRPPQFAKGTEVRSRRAALKRAIKDGSIDGFAILAGDGQDAQQATASEMPLVALLLAIPGIGATTVETLLGDRGIPGDARLWALTDERRRELADAAKEAIG